ARERREARVLPEGRIAEQPAQQAPLRVGEDRDRDPAVVAAAGIDAVRRGVLAAVAVARHHLAARATAHDRLREAVDAGLALRDLEVLALAGALAVEERRGEDARDVAR